MFCSLIYIYNNSRDNRGYVPFAPTRPAWQKKKHTSYVVKKKENNVVWFNNSDLGLCFHMLALDLSFQPHNLSLSSSPSPFQTLGSPLNLFFFISCRISSSPSPRSEVQFGLHLLHPHEVFCFLTKPHSPSPLLLHLFQYFRLVLLLILIYYCCLNTPCF